MELLNIDSHVIPGAYAYATPSVRSLGTEIAWVNNDHLYAFVPGQSRPELIYTSAQGSYIPDFVGSSAGYALLTQETVKGDSSFRWRLWFLAGAGSEPVLVDEFDNDSMPLPTLAMDARHIAWARTRGAGDDVVSELRILDIDELDRPRTLATYPYWETNVEHPALNGDELWYGVRVNDWDAGTESPRVEMLDLADPGAPPVVYGQDQRAFMPSANDEVVVWKGGGSAEDSADAWGSLYVYRRSDGSVERIQGVNWPGKPGDDRVMYPSVGDRFVAWWDGSAKVDLYDLTARAVIHVVKNDPYGNGLAASVAGNLLAFESPGDAHHMQLNWAQLPD